MATETTLGLQIARAQAGDPSAMEEVLSRQVRRVHCIARALGSPTVDCEDLAQEALLKVHRRLTLFRGQSTFATWVYSVVRNLALDAVRTRAARRGPLEEPAEERTHPERRWAACPEELLMREQTKRAVHEALSQMPAQFRRAVILFELEGWTYEEIAELEDVSVGTVKSRLSRGRSSLRRLLSDEVPKETAESMY